MQSQNSWNASWWCFKVSWKSLFSIIQKLLTWSKLSVFMFCEDQAWISKNENKRGNSQRITWDKKMVNAGKKYSSHIPAYQLMYFTVKLQNQCIVTINERVINNKIRKTKNKWFQIWVLTWTNQGSFTTRKRKKT